MKYKLTKGEEIRYMETDEPRTAESYGQKYGYVVELLEDDRPKPMTQAEVEEMLLDQEYRILLLEYGLEDTE